MQVDGQLKIGDEVVVEKRFFVMLDNKHWISTLRAPNFLFQIPST